MKKFFPLIVVAVSLFITNSCSAQKASDFLPPAAGGKTKADESKIIDTEISTKDKTGIVVAKTMQDGVAQSVEKMTGSTDEFDSPTIMTVVTLSGQKARVATGSSVVPNLDKLENEDQKREAVRDTMIRAYSEAQTNLVKALSDKVVAESTVGMMDKVKTAVGGATDRNTLRALTEKIGENFNGICRPRIWDVKQNDDGRVEITVYHIENDKDAEPISAGDDVFKSCLDKEYSKIKSGRLLPEGGEIYKTSKGEYCYVGYANAVILHSDAKEEQAELTDDAKRTATLRAQNALLGIMNGKGCKRVTSMEGTATRAKGSLDGLSGDTPEQGFNTSSVSSTVTDIEVKGTLPPGVEIRTIKVPSGNYYYAFAMYKTKEPKDPINAQVSNKN
jgi:hypothetical protein